MRTFKKKSKNLLAIFSTIGLATFMLSSCVKQNNNYVAIPPVAAIAVIQASADQPPVDLLVGGVKVNNVPLAYGQTFDYVTVHSGKNALSFVNDVSQKSIVADTLQFNQNTRYSVFLVNTVNSPQVFMLTDTPAMPINGTSSVRFVNLGPDAGPVDVVVKDGATITANKPFKGFSSFTALDGNRMYTLEVHQAGTGNVLASVTAKFNPGYIYTIWFHGLTAGTAGMDGLAVDIFTNGVFQ
jgi:hypothetical protein